MKYITLLAVLFLSGCATSHEEAYSTASKAGMKDIEVGTTSWYGCSEDDYQGRYFTATNANGQRIEGLVCCGLYKRCTIRY